MVDAVSTTNPTKATQANLLNNNNTSAEIKTDVTGLADNFNNFLKLFLTQLKNQDPTSPLDTNQMTSQLAQFAGVEQSIKQNVKLDQLISQNKNFEMSSAVSYTGSEVRVEGSKFELKNSKSAFSYKLDEKAERATIVIKDADGTIVNSIDADVTAGEHVYDWDGTDFTGAKAPDGVYQVQVYTGSADQALEQAQKTFISSTVIGVDVDPKTSVINLQLSNGEKVPSSKVLFVGAKRTQI